MSAIAISDIQFRVTVNPKGLVTRKNVLYKIKNRDGSIDQIERNFCRWFRETRPENQQGKVILEAPVPAALPNLKKNITLFESGNKLGTPIGALILKEQFQAPPPKKPPTPKPPTITEQLKASLTKQKAEIEALKRQVVDLGAQVRKEINDIERNSEIIANIERNIRRLNALIDV